MDYNEVLKENLLLRESIPWRNGNIFLNYGVTTIAAHSYKCLVLHDLSFLFTLKPSFMIVVPEMEDFLKEKNAGVNGMLIVPREAQQLAYTKKETGTCSAKTFFFGRPNPDRLFDFYFRIFERGFSIYNFKNLPSLEDIKVIEMTTLKKQFSKIGMFFGGAKPPKNGVYIQVRLNRVDKE